MSIVLRNTATKIEIEYTVSGAIQEVNKGSFRLHKRDERVWMTFRSGDSGTLAIPQIEIDYKQVTTPSGIDTAQKLYDLIQGWNDGDVGYVLDGNSTTDILGIGGVFPGEVVSILNYGIIYVNVSTDVASATDGLSIQQSSDGVNWDHDDVYTVPAGGNKNYAINPHAFYLKVVYTNGGVEQGYFRLQTIGKTNGLASSHRIQDPIIDDDDARLVKSVLTAKLDGDGFDNIEATASGNLRVTDAESGLAIASGDVVGTSFIHKFGAAPDFDNTDGFVTIWDGADDGHVDRMQYIYSTSAIIDSISSGINADTQDIMVEGLDASYALVIQTITLTGQTRKALDTNLIRVFRMVNVNSTDNAGHIYCYENTALSSGQPIDATKIRAIIQPGNNQTLMAVYTVPAGQTGYMRDWFASTAGANKNSNYVIHLIARPFGQVFQLKHVSALNETGSSLVQHMYTEPEVFTEKTDIELLCFVTAGGTTTAAVSGGYDVVLKVN